ncbi:MAG TPA: GlxA family transcriptional regulator [Acetobacteraceae bacterium]|jgi:AraC family carnitine catabolism transcriptional activator|nr:GlxA family transcriptional regulator [Acetobacteraceae bacterium]
MDHPHLIHFLLVPDFPLYAVVPATEALRIANQNARVALYDWRFVSVGGGPVRASNGMWIEAASAVTGGALPDCVIVCSGNEPMQHLARPFLAWLRRLAAHGTTLGALDTGAFALAAAGVIRDRKVTLHWEAMPVFRDAFPRIDVSEQIFVIDRDIVTAAGGVASLDLVVALIGRAHGPHLAQVVTDAFVHGRPRPADTPQRTDTVSSLEGATVLNDVLHLMNENVQFRLDLSEICARVRISRRRLERMFMKQTGRSPAATYLDIRLTAAREQLFYSNNSICHIAEVTGFQSDAHFCRAFRRRFGAAPSEIRRDFQAEQRSKYYPAGTRLLVESMTG